MPQPDWPRDVISPMIHSVDHNDLDAALRRCGSHWTAAQAHGLLCGRLSTAGTDGALPWRDQLFDGVNADNALRAECESVLESLLQSTWQQLAERQSEFELLLPDDSDDAGLRAQALGHWCEGFLHGLVSEKQNEALKSKLQNEPLSDMVRDMLEITRAGVGEEDDAEENESAYTEIVEYVRVAAQLAYEELADTRPAGTEPPLDGADETLH